MDISQAGISSWSQESGSCNWRTTEFTDADEDSKITVTLTPVKAGARLTLVHSSVPDGHTSYKNGGWRDYYFKPMEKYFGKSRKMPVR